nr:hypothetical protein [Tanacetum cinerariifolium]
VPQDYDVSSATPCFFIHVIYAISCLYIRSLSVMLSRISFHVLIRQTFFKTLCLFNYTLMIRQDYDITSSLRRGALQILVSEPGYETVGSKDLTCEDWMVNTRTDTDLSAAVQNALLAMLHQIREEIREEFRTGSGSSNAGGNPPPVTIHTSFEKATVPVDAENWISHMEKIFNVMGCEDAVKTRLAVYKFEDFKKLFFLQFFPRAEQERLKREYHSIRQTSSETSTEFMQRFLRLTGFLRAAAGTEEEQAKNFQWGLRRQRSGDRHQLTSQQSSHRSHGQNNDRHGSDRGGGNDNHRGSNNNNNYSGSNNRNSGNRRDQRNRGHQSNRSANYSNSSIDALVLVAFDLSFEGISSRVKIL